MSAMDETGCAADKGEAALDLIHHVAEELANVATQLLATMAYIQERAFDIKHADGRAFQRQPE